LRLEKGHLIVGQDTDALTNPYEAGVDWAVGKNKGFFVGARSLEILHKRPLGRRLVGLVFPSGDHGPLPDECHLIMADGQIAGRVTSIAKRTTLGYPVAMAFVRPELSQPGTPVQIRLDGDRHVEAEVASLPFYDPDNTRQH
jgi:sarcosine oxidase subunit alpha